MAGIVDGDTVNVNEKDEDESVAQERFPAINEPPTLTSPPIPTPPVTTKAPFEVEVEALVLVKLVTSVTPNVLDITAGPDTDKLLVVMDDILAQLLT